MATASAAPVTKAGHRHTLSVLRLLITGGVSATLVFIFCWIGTFIPFSSPTHAYIGLFTPADMNSGEALFEGTLWSLLFGALAGAIFAVVYNWTARLDRN